MRCIKTASGALPGRPGQAVGRGHRTICTALYRGGCAERQLVNQALKSDGDATALPTGVVRGRMPMCNRPRVCGYLPRGRHFPPASGVASLRSKAVQGASLCPPANNRMESGNQMGHAPPSMPKAAPAGRVSAMAFAAVPDAVEPPFPHVHRHVSIKGPTRSREPRSNPYFHCHPPVTENRCRKA